MRSWPFPLFLLLCLFSAGRGEAQHPDRSSAAIVHPAAPTRPTITGISHIAVYATDPIKTGAFYRSFVGCAKTTDFEDHPGVRYMVNAGQYVEILPLPSSAGVDRLDHIAFRTGNLDAMMRYLLAHSVPVPDPVHKSSSGTRWLEVKDFEGNKVQFVEDTKFPDIHSAAPELVGHRIIHLGMAVRSRAEADSFYRDVLGFRLYWHGGVDPEKTDWVSMQVPDGTDWLEYMLTSGASGSGIPYRITEQALGVLNHFSIGVADMATAVATLKAENRTGPQANGPRIGRDGKWQFNDFDPDGTRIEYMEFAPKAKPCCSDFTAPHPSASDE